MLQVIQGEYFNCVNDLWHRWPDSTAAPEVAQKPGEARDQGIRRLLTHSGSLNSGSWLAKTPFHLARPVCGAKRGCSDGCEGEKAFRLAFVAAVQTSAAGQPGDGPFHHPAIPAQALERIDSLASDAVADATRGESSPQVAVVVALVPVQLAGP